MNNNKYQFDVLYIGGGHAAYDGSIPLALGGKKVAIVTDDLMGGTCTNRGCNAKIVLDSPVSILKKASDLSGVLNGNFSVDWKANQAHKHHVVDHLNQRIKKQVQEAGVSIFDGHARFLDKHTVVANGQTYSAKNIVIATGQRPRTLEFSGNQYLHDSTDFLLLEEMPKKMTIIGGGYIAIEAATMALAAGSEVTILLRGKTALKSFYQPFAELLLDDLENQGAKILRSTEVLTVKENGASEYSVNTSGEIIETDWVLNASGRVPNIENMDLNIVGVETNQHGVIVNEFLQTSNPNIFASGDVIDKNMPKLTPTAIFESLYLTSRFLNENNEPISYPAIPTSVFSSPRVAQVGVNINEAENDSENYSIKEMTSQTSWFRQAAQEKIFDAKLIFNKENKLVGVSEISNDADGVINALLPIIELGLDADQINRLLPIFPTFASTAFHQL